MAKPLCYDVHAGCMGWVERYNKWMLFASYRDYIEYIEED